MNMGNPDRDLTQAVERVTEVVESIFTSLREATVEADQLWARLAVDGAVTTAQLSALRPSIERRLATHAYFDGTGLVVDPSALGDAGRYQEWWRPTSDGGYEFLDVHHSFGEETYDYTHMSWFVGAARGLDSVRGPYVDLSGSDRYVLTFAVPAYHAGAFIGASGADITLANFESLLIADLSTLDSEVVVVNAADRVVVSSSPEHSPGERMRAAAQTDAHIGGFGVNWRVHRI